MKTDYIEVLDPTGDTAQIDLKPSDHSGGIDNKIIGLNCSTNVTNRPASSR